MINFKCLIYEQMFEIYYVTYRKHNKYNLFIRVQDVISNKEFDINEVSREQFIKRRTISSRISIFASTKVNIMSKQRRCRKQNSRDGLSSSHVFMVGTLYNYTQGHPCSQCVDQTPRTIWKMIQAGKYRSCCTAVCASLGVTVKEMELLLDHAYS
ncbi:hypothetical protein HOLleu_19117 [Holothuria leucospilota]|uniref:Uncharacterized protein n=1 Tax=Holothuria leucospilota TaxID=206669 RepID=A0A9Q1H9Y7_HOLLE|nr:hypothetical protein HOLleu_19117 [Holothuria leucospilota]